MFERAVFESVESTVAVQSHGEVAPIAAVRTADVIGARALLLVPQLWARPLSAPPLRTTITADPPVGTIHILHAISARATDALVAGARAHVTSTALPSRNQLTRTDMTVALRGR